MSDQNPHPGDTHQSQSPVGCPTPPPSGLTLIGALAEKDFHAKTLQIKLMVIKITTNVTGETVNRF